MGNCLVTKLKENVNNDNLLKLGEIKIEIKYGHESGNIFNLRSSAADCLIKIKTGGVTFTNSGFEGQTEQLMPQNALRTIGVSGPCVLTISNRYSITNLSDQTSGYVDLSLDDLSECTLRQIHLASYTYSTGNIKGLKNSSTIESLTINSRNIYGDIADLPASAACYFLTLRGNIYGNISRLSTMSSLTDVILSNMPNLTGDVSNLSGLTDLRDIYFNDTDLYGNISNFANHNSLRILEIHNTRITGKLPDLMVNTPAIKNAYLPTGVVYTQADLEAADAIMRANGGTPGSSGYCISGGTLVESY